MSTNAVDSSGLILVSMAQTAQHDCDTASKEKGVSPHFTPVGTNDCNTWLAEVRQNPTFLSQEKSILGRGCKMPRIECVCCNDPTIGGNATDDYNTGNTIIQLCYDNRNSPEADPVHLLVHEMFHALQDCWGTNMRGCMGAMAAEIEAYFCETQCSFDECVKSAIGSNCKPRGNNATPCVPEDFTPAMLEELKTWFNGHKEVLCTYPTDPTVPFLPPQWPHPTLPGGPPPYKPGAPCTKPLPPPNRPWPKEPQPKPPPAHCNDENMQPWEPPEEPSAPLDPPFPECRG
jgi:hypothetical protein